MTKYTKEIKLAIYHEWVDDHRRGTYLSRKYGMERGGIQYLVDLIQKHGEALRQLGLTNTGILANWLRSFKENGYTVITKKKGRPPKNAQKQGQTADQRTGRAGKEAYSRVCIHKKLEALIQERKSQEKKN